MIYALLLLFAGSVVVATFVLSYLLPRQVHIWAPSYWRRDWRPTEPVAKKPIHLFVCLADHFEPAWLTPGAEIETRRVDAWVTGYRALAARHRDADGRAPQHTFFYPIEEYRPQHLHKLAALCRDGLGDVEVHLHHDGDTADELREQLLSFARTLHERHGLLRENRETGQVEYGFIHGNWALDNSRRDGRWCGVDNELTVLRETGCYADFTLPSAPDETQTRKINSIYYASDDPERPKSHDEGVDVRVGRSPSGDLMLIQGPLMLNWRRRKWGVLPRIENGELSADNPPSADRIDLWVKCHVHVKGRPEWVFIKLHTHGAQERNFEILFGDTRHAMLDYLEQQYNDGERYRLHYVTAREMYELAKLAEEGSDVDPGTFLGERRDVHAPVGSARP
ncbi:MAG: hypothetical protein JSV80_16465 [Acidobacteriota bacterium]|nr:MAG: hypothetical protein JSV80_16465 [Acidobacteriota bacterium]